MKTKRYLALILTLAVLLGVVIMPASASYEHSEGEIEIFIENNDISDETKERLIAYYSTPEKEDDGVETCGLTCTLFGHKLEQSSTYTITHKARATAPRCLKKTYSYEACTRCDYEKSTLVSSTYIHCCS